MKQMPTLLKRHQSATASAMNSGAPVVRVGHLVWVLPGRSGR